MDLLMNGLILYCQSALFLRAKDNELPNKVCCTLKHAPASLFQMTRNRKKNAMFFTMLPEIIRQRKVQWKQGERRVEPVITGWMAIAHSLSHRPPACL